MEQQSYTSTHPLGHTGPVTVSLYPFYLSMWGTRWRSWLRHWVTRREVAVSILDGVIGIFLWRNLFGRNMALGLTHTIKEMSSRNISWGGGGLKAAGVYSCQPYHLRVPTVMKSGSLKLLEPSGPVQACNGITWPLLIHLFQKVVVLGHNKNRQPYKANSFVIFLTQIKHSQHTSAQSINRAFFRIWQSLIWSNPKINGNRIFVTTFSRTNASCNYKFLESSPQLINWTSISISSYAPHNI